MFFYFVVCLNPSCKNPKVFQRALSHLTANLITSYHQVITYNGKIFVLYELSFLIFMFSIRDRSETKTHSAAVTWYVHIPQFA